MVLFLGFPKKPHTNWILVLLLPIILSMSNWCGTLAHTNNPPIEESFPGPPHKLGFPCLSLYLSTQLMWSTTLLTTFKHTPYIEGHLLARGSPYHFIWLLPRVKSRVPLWWHLLINLLAYPSPYWYDIFHFGPNPSWLCFLASLKRSILIEYSLSLYTHDPCYI